MRLHPRAASLLPLLLLVLLAPARGEAASAFEPSLACAPAPTRVTSFAKLGSAVSSLAKVDVEATPTLFFSSTDPTGGTALWTAVDTSGAVVTTQLRTWPGTVSLSRFTAASGVLYFVATENFRTALWSTDGTLANTTQLAAFDNASLTTGGGFAVLGRTLVFMAATDAQGYELWSSDGTAAGTRLVKDINPGIGDSFPLELTVLNGKVFFAADDGLNGNELWVSDGVPDGPGTHLVKDIRGGRDGSSPSSLRVMDGQLFFSASTTGQAELWRSDGTEAGTQLAVSNATLGENHTPLAELTVVGKTLFFHMDTGDLQNPTGDELWRSDGTEAGTRIVKELQVGAGSSAPQKLVAVGDTLFFMASDGQTGQELWKTDGTDAGTVLVKDFVPGSSNPPGDEILAPGPGALLVAINDNSADNDNSAGKELWKVNREGAERLTDIVPEEGSSDPHGMTVAGGTLYFVATYPGEGEELVALPLNQVDCVPPQVVCPGNLRVEATSRTQTPVFMPPPRDMRDDSLTPLTVEYSLPRPWAFELGETSAKVIVSDAARNRVECPLTVTVEDRTPPALVCPRQLLQEAQGPGGTSVFFPVTASDAVTPSPSVGFSRGSGSVFQIGQEEEIVATATDEQGNTSTCQFTVLVQDTVPPTIVCPPSVVRAAMSAEPVPITYPQPQVQDTVGVTKVSADHESGSLFGVGTWPVTLTAEDAAGNQSQCTFTVYNQDVVAPSLTCPGPQQVVATEDEGAAVSFPEATAADQLGPPTVRYSQEPGSTFPVGETIVTATARDLGGNEVSCSFPVTVLERPAGCGCQSGSASASVFWLVLVLMPLWTRRRAARLAR